MTERDSDTAGGGTSSSRAASGKQGTGQGEDGARDKLCPSCVVGAVGKLSLSQGGHQGLPGQARAGKAGEAQQDGARAGNQDPEVGLFLVSKAFM